MSSRFAWIALSIACVSGSGTAAPLGLPEPPTPRQNPPSAAKIALGKRLFHDVRFSRDGHISCASCHDEAKVFTDSPRVTSIGVADRTGVRNAPSCANAVYYEAQFWDGRAATLEEQAKQPFVNPAEMDLPNLDAVVDIIQGDAEYARAFGTVFHRTPKRITIDDVARAIASYERSLVFGDSPFDRYYFKGEREALSAPARRGLTLFLGHGGCARCHTVDKRHALFTDSRYHDIGIGPDDLAPLARRLIEADPSRPLSTRELSELGRFAITRKPEDLGAFKTPGLRNVALTAPYMHDGSLADLRAVVLHYVAGGGTSRPGRGPGAKPGGISPLEISARDVEDLVAFLDALTSPAYAGAATPRDDSAPATPKPE